MSQSSRDASDADAKARAEISLAAPSWIVLVLLALTPAVFATGYPNFEFFKELIFIGGAGLALVLWGIQALRTRAVSMMAGRVTVLVIVFGLYTLAASLWADNQLLGLWDSLHFVALAAVALVVTSPVGRPLRFYDFAVATGVGAALAAVFGLLDLAGVGVFTVVWDPPGATGAFDAMEFAAAYYVVALPILVAATFRFPGRARIFFAACFALAGFHFAMMSGWGWAAIFAAVCAATVLIVVAFQRSEAFLVLTPVVVLLGVLAVFLAVAQWGLEPPAQTSDATSLPRVMQPEELIIGENAPRGEVRNPVFAAERMESVTSDLARSYLLEVGTDLFAEKPFVGHGAGSWWPLQTKEVNIDHPFVEGMFELYPAFRSPHSGVIKLLVEYGLVGLVLFGLWLAATVAVTLGALGRRTERAGWILEHWALLTAALAGVTFMFFTPLLELAPSALTWVAALAVLTRFSASLNDFRGWSSVWSARSDEDAGFFTTVNGAALLAVLIGVGVLVPTGLNGVSGYWRGLADHYMLKTHYRRAISAYKDAGRWYPAYGDVPLNIALASSRLGELTKVPDFVDRAVEQRPWDVRALVLEGRTKLGLADRAEAVRLGNRAVKAFPNSVQARDLLIAALDVQARYKEAIEQANDLLERDPPPEVRVKFHIMIGDLYFDILKEFPQAKKHYEKALDLIESPERRARMKKKISQIDKLIEHQRRLIEGKPPVDSNKKMPRGPKQGPVVPPGQ